MTYIGRRTFWLTSFISCGLVACDLSLDEPEIAEVSQALGGFYTLLHVGNELPMDLGPSRTVFRNQPSETSCGIADVVDTQTGQRLPVPALAGCANITAASSQYRVFVADQQTTKIYWLLNNPPPTGPGPRPAGLGGLPTGYTWQTTTTANAMVTRMIDTPIYLYWYDDHVLHRVTSPYGFEDRNVAVDGILLHATDDYAIVQTSVSGGNYELRQYKFNNGVSFQVLATASASFASWFSADANYYYWTVPSSGSNVIRKLPLAGGAPSNVKVSSTTKYMAPVSTGSALYWVQTRVGGGANTLVRRNLSNGNQVSVTFPFPWYDGFWYNPMRVYSGGLYFAPSATSTTNDWTLYRGQL